MFRRKLVLLLVVELAMAGLSLTYAGSSQSKANPTKKATLTQATYQKFMHVSGSQVLFEQFLSALEKNKVANPPPIKERVAAFKKDVEARSFAIYQKHYQESEILAVIKFYESVVGKKYTQLTPEMIGFIQTSMKSSGAPKLDPKRKSLLDEVRSALDLGNPALQPQVKPDQVKKAGEYTLQFLSSKFTDDELKSLVEFHRSAEGKKFVQNKSILTGEMSLLSIEMAKKHLQGVTTK